MNPKNVPAKTMPTQGVGKINAEPHREGLVWERMIPILTAGSLFLCWTLCGLGSEIPNFPFTIQGGRFLSNGVPVFLNLVSYQPLEPGQAIDGEIRESRVQDDLRRFRNFLGGSDPILLRVYAQPTAGFPRRMPKSFYDGVRELGFWIVRDIYFQDNFQARNAVELGRAAVDAVINEVAAAGAFDRIFAWEIGNEFRAVTQEANVALENFVCAMRDHLKSRMSAAGREAFSKWVTWASWVQNDPLRTVGNRVLPACLDYASYNAYSYEPERMRDHQAGPVTGTPYAGYLSALKEQYLNVPLVISETGLPNSPSAATTGDQHKVPPVFPSYRYGGLTGEQVAEGLVDRYWDARLSGAVAGFGLFEWNDEWHKAGDPNRQADHPEEHFGLIRFAGSPLQARFKLHQESVRSLFTLKFSNDAPSLSLTAENTSLTSTGATTIRATLPPEMAPPVRLRWESSRGHVVGDSNAVQFFAGGRALGPALVTVLAVDVLGRARKGTIELAIQPASPPRIRILTLGQGSNNVARTSGRVENVDLSRYKLVTYIQTDKNYVQPYIDMASIWIRPDGYWWTPVDNRFRGRVVAWLVPKGYKPPATLAANATPSGVTATASTSTVNDTDNDLLPDNFEPDPAQGRYDDPDGDGANNLEEFLAGSSPSIPDNDSDADGLPDTWERHYFGTLRFGVNDDPDADGLPNSKELELGIHPGRTAVDRDRDGLPDAWELQWLGNLNARPDEDADGDGRSNLEAYELGMAPTREIPSLSIRLSGSGGLAVFWPASAKDFVLEAAMSLNPTGRWSRVPVVPLQSGSQSSVTLKAADVSSFFRLRRP